jgi:hypothetical protein
VSVSPGSPTHFRRVRVEAAATEAPPPSSEYHYFVVDESEHKIVRVPLARFCAYCGLAKPARCHHCSQCGVCHLKMDHHCPWINNCVGYRNYKFFVLALLHGAAFLGFVAGTLLDFLVHIPVDPRTGKTAFQGFYVNFIVATSIAILIAVPSVVLLIYHIRLLCLNRTTIEQIDRASAIDRAMETHPGMERKMVAKCFVDVYDMGVWRNLTQVLGHCIILWIFPVPHNECLFGFVFPRRQQPDPISSSASADRSSARSVLGRTSCEAESAESAVLSPSRAV